MSQDIVNNTGFGGGPALRAPDLTINIASQGDLILVVGPSQRKLRVLSAVISMACLSSTNSFGEVCGRARVNDQGLKYVVRPMMNEDAVEMICQVIHHKISQRYHLAPELVFAMALAATELQCGQSLQFAMVTWLQPLNMGINGNVRGLVYLMAAAYIFGDVSAFRGITKQLLMHRTGGFMSLALQYPEVFAVVPERMLCMLEILGAICVFYLKKAIADGRWDPMRSGPSGRVICFCTWGYERFLYYGLSLHGSGLTPHQLHGRSIWAIGQSIIHLNDPQPLRPTRQCLNDQHVSPNFCSLRNQRVGFVYRAATLCLYCVQADALGKAVCTAGHQFWSYRV
ncbi:hypothetical protein LEMA_P068220.1 [Plenodomus lingam JN3]|uniref:BTB domain-containing protein n=1 Tax=Leptosphaeria maculans (strain JN3 / isolate v23.1.3 / race Av1-4-5-6-7-8) TaxID=985895 RepID=E4ZJM9_LEPMJ|nr:hypothetical protein LEMA_P068220.1 [Plenodomus lingam JN3]CBX91314.1 hypothetical protein LEMA_P068220.1 [Plenodomus lingam JN3]